MQYRFGIKNISVKREAPLAESSSIENRKNPEKKEVREYFNPNTFGPLKARLAQERMQRPLEREKALRDLNQGFEETYAVKFNADGSSAIAQKQEAPPSEKNEELEKIQKEKIACEEGKQVAEEKKTSSARKLWQRLKGILKVNSAEELAQKEEGFIRGISAGLSLDASKEQQNIIIARYLQGYQTDLDKTNALKAEMQNTIATNGNDETSPERTTETVHIQKEKSSEVAQVELDAMIQQVAEARESDQEVIAEEENVKQANDEVQAYQEQERYLNAYEQVVHNEIREENIVKMEQEGIINPQSNNAPEVLAQPDMVDVISSLRAETGQSADDVVPQYDERYGYYFRDPDTGKIWSAGSDKESLKQAIELHEYFSTPPLDRLKVLGLPFLLQLKNKLTMNWTREVGGDEFSHKEFRRFVLLKMATVVHEDEKVTPTDIQQGGMLFTEKIRPKFMDPERSREIIAKLESGDNPIFDPSSKQLRSTAFMNLFESSNMKN